MSEGLTENAPGPGSLVKKVVSGAAIGGGIKLAGVGLAFLFFLVMARALTPEDFGVFATAFSAATIAGFIATLGQHTSILRFWPALDELHGRAVAAQALRFGLIAVFTGGGAVLAAGAVLSATPIRLNVFGNDGSVFLWTGALALGFALSEFSVAALRARGALIVALGPREIGWRVVVIAAILLTGHLTDAQALALTALALIAVTLPQMIVIANDIRRHRRTALPEPERRSMRQAVWGLWALAGVNQIATHSTTVVIGLVLGPTSAGAFFAADRLARLLTIALIGVNQIVGPMLARSYHAGRREEVQAMVSAGSAVAFTIAIIGCAIYVPLGEYALSLFAPEYRAYQQILLILSAGQVVNTALGLSGVVLSLAGKERTFLKIMVGWASTGLVTIYLGSSFYGLEGGALSASIVIACWNVNAAIACRSKLGISLVSLRSIVKLTSIGESNSRASN